MKRSFFFTKPFQTFQVKSYKSALLWGKITIHMKIDSKREVFEKNGGLLGKRTEIS